MIVHTLQEAVYLFASAVLFGFGFAIGGAAWAFVASTLQRKPAAQ